MTLLYLKELKTRSRDRTYEANLVNEYQVKVCKMSVDISVFICSSHSMIRLNIMS